MTENTNRPISEYLEEIGHEVDGVSAILRCMTFISAEEQPTTETITDALLLLAEKLELVSESLIDPAIAIALADGRTAPHPSAG